MREQPRTDVLSCHPLDLNFNVSRETHTGRSNSKPESRDVSRGTRERHRLSAPAAHLSLTHQALCKRTPPQGLRRGRSRHRSLLCSMSRRTVVVLWPRRTIQMVTTEFSAPLRDTVHITGSGPHPSQGSVEHRLAAHGQTSPGPTHDDRVELAPQPVAATSRSSPCITGSHPSWGTFTCAGSLGQREARTNPPTIVKPRTPWRAQRHPDQTRNPLRAGHDNGPTFSQLVSTFLTRARTAPGHSPEPPSRFVAARTVDASELHAHGRRAS